MRRLLVRSGGRRRRPRTGVPWPPPPPSPAAAATASSRFSSRSSIQWQHPPPAPSAALLGRPDAPCVNGGVFRTLSSSSQPPPPSPPTGASNSNVADDAQAAGAAAAAAAPDPAVAAANRQAFLAMLEPADAAQAVTLLEAAEAETGLAFTATVAGACNAYLTGLARQNDARLLGKAFDYLGAFRGQLPPEGLPRVPSASARHELIRACGRCVRGVTQTLAARRRPGPPPAYNQTPQPAPASSVAAAGGGGGLQVAGEGEGPEGGSSGDGAAAAEAAGGPSSKPRLVPGPGGDILLFTSLPASMVSRATVARFMELAEALFQDYLASFPPPPHMSPVDPGQKQGEGDQGQGGSSASPALAEYLRVTSLLVSDMVYTYLQAGETRKALDLFERMRRARPAPVLPDEYGTSAIVKALAKADRPDEGFALLEELERDGVPVHLYPGLYLAILRGIARALGSKPPQAERLRRIAQLTLARMREKGFVPPVAVLQGLMRVEAKFGHYREVQSLLKEMRARSLPPGPVEYALLISALGEGGSPQGVAAARARMAEEGVAPDEGVYLALLRAYDRAGDVAKARAVFAEAVRRLRLGQEGQEGQQQSTQPPTDPRRLYTAMMRCLLRGREPVEALDLFQAYRRARGPGTGTGPSAGKGNKGGRKGGTGGEPVAFPPPDEAMCAIALRAASAVGGAGAARRLYDELLAAEAEAGGRKRRDGVSALGGNAAASLLAAHVDAEDWDGAYALFDRIRAAQRQREQERRAQQQQGAGQRQRGGERGRGEDGATGAAAAPPPLSARHAARQSISPYNVLIHGLVKRGRFEEARAVAERAREDGVPFDGTTFRGLAKAAGGEVLLPWAREDWQPPARVYLVKEGDEGRAEDEEGAEEDEGEDEGGGGGGALWLDMHRLTAAEARELLARELGRLRERFDAAEAAAAKEGVGQGQEAAGGGDDDDGLRDLVLVTGYRRRQRQPPQQQPPQEQESGGKEGEGELKAVVRELLAARGLLFFHPPGNPGCFRVPRASLREYFEREHKAESELRFFRLTLLRYIPVASLVALVALVPKGGLPL